MTFIRVALLLGLCVALGGCVNARTGSPLHSKDYHPTKLGETSAMMDFAGTKIPAQLEEKLEGNLYTIDVVAHGELLESEVYRSDSTQFSIHTILSEEYRPVLPLLTFPLAVPSQGKWSGSISSGGMSRKATASIKRYDSSLKIPDFMMPTLAVDVELRIDGGGPEPSIRQLKFQFANEKGLIYREFGTELSRTPMKPIDVGGDDQ